MITTTQLDELERLHVAFEDSIHDEKAWDDLADKLVHYSGALISSARECERLRAENLNLRKQLSNKEWEIQGMISQFTGGSM